MPDKQALLDLAARCEAAADRQLDAEIAMARGHAVEHRPGDDWFYAPETEGFGRKRVPAYSASLDAAMTLYVSPPERIPFNPRLATAEALRQQAEAA